MPTPVWRIEIRPLPRPRPTSIDASAVLPAPTAQQWSAVYLIEASWSTEQAVLAARELFCDPVDSVFSLHCGDGTTAGPAAQVQPFAAAVGPLGDVLVEVHLLPGVMDPAAGSALLALADMGLSAESVRSVRAIRLARAPTADELARLYNPAIEWVLMGPESCRPTPTPPQADNRLQHVRLTDLDDTAMLALSRRMHLFLDLTEMQAIANAYRQMGREPTDVELETLAQTWSEHCVHKTLKAAVSYTERPATRPSVLSPSQQRLLDSVAQDRAAAIPPRFNNLIRETVFAATMALKRSWCWSVFVDNAGVISVDDEAPLGVCFKVETHNRPSAIEPYGGAATGVGGCIRDILGTGLGAKPIANTDVFCLAPPDLAADRVPPGSLEPARVLRGVVAGVRDYGNRMGIATVNGGLYFDPRYVANPLVFCGCVGLIPADKVTKSVQPGDRIVVLGGRTGRDGIHGATFSSGEIEHSTAQTFGGAVQIGNAIEEKKLLDALLIARDAGVGGSSLYRAVTDCGAGGLSSAIGEMGSELGACVQLDRVPLKYAGLRYDEIWISEAQERMVLAVPPEHLDALLTICLAEGVEATDIGWFGHRLVAGGATAEAGTPGVELRMGDAVVGQLPCALLHDAIPRRDLIAEWAPKQTLPTICPSGDAAGAGGSASTADRQPVDLLQRLLAALSDWNTRSREPIWRQYDHEVQGRTVLKPEVQSWPQSDSSADADSGTGDAFHHANGTTESIELRGPTDAAVLWLVPDRPVGVTISHGLCPHVSDIDPYWMAVAAVDEAVRNAVAVGADPHRLAILDNFCWGTCTKPDRLAALVRAAQGCHDAALAYGTPFISGKDSLNNEYHANGWDLVIPGTLLVSAIGRIADWRKPTRPTLHAGHPVYLVGAPSRIPGQPLGSWRHNIALPSDAVLPPAFDMHRAVSVHHAVASVIAQGMASACHDVSDGGLLVALAEMVLGSDCSLLVSGHQALVNTASVAASVPPSMPTMALGLEAALFGEWPACYVVQTASPVQMCAALSSLNVPYIGLGMAVPRNDAAALLVRTSASSADIQAYWSRFQLWQACHAPWPADL